MFKRLRENKKLWQGVLLVAMGIFLLIAVWSVFLKKESTTASVMSAEEERLAAILEKIEGVGEAEVMIGVSETGERSVVVVCDGGNSLSVIMDVREAAAAALGIEQKLVKVYLKN